MYVISMFMFGIDEIAMQCEEPFSILPQQGYCNEIYNNCMEIAKYDYDENDATVVPTAANDETIVHNPSRRNVNVAFAAGNSRSPDIKSDDTVEPDATAQHQPESSTNHADQYMMGRS